MTKNKIIITGTKESFLVKVLTGKLKDAGFDGEFVNWNGENLSDALKSAAIVTLYINDGESIPKETARLLSDRMAETGTKMMIVGNDDQFNLVDYFGDKICRTFNRPLDNTEFVNAVKEIMDQITPVSSKRSILVIDDDPNYLGLVREWLKDSYKVAMVSSGLQGIKWLGKNKADLILLDYEMPVNSGPQVLEMLRGDENTKSIPVMFLTGKSDKESIMEVVSLQTEGYFLKTIQKEELLKNLDEFFVLHKNS